MRTIYNLSTRTKLSYQQTKTPDIKLQTISLVIGIMALLGATAPFWHIWADKTSVEKFVGFPNFRIFLYSFGNYFALFCLALFLFWVKNFIDPRYSSINKIINLVGGVFLAVSIYFLLWVFNPSQDFPKYIYNVAFGVAAVILTYGVYRLNQFIIHAIWQNKTNIKELLSFAFRVRNKHYKKVAKKALYAEMNGEPKLSNQTVSDNIIEFEDDFYKTLNKVN